MIRVWLSYTAAAMILAMPGATGQTRKTATVHKPRVIVTTDGEIDDRCSMVRFLLYTDEWDVRGLIHSSSKYHWKGDARHKAHRWADESWLDRQLDAYARVYPMLKANAPGYPPPAYLRRQVFEGNVAYEGDMDSPSPGSDHIVSVLLEPDSSPVWLLAWGGSNTIARALKTIEEDHPGRMAEVSRKARLFLITIQDGTLNSYLLKHWEKTPLILSTAFGALAYRWRHIMSPEQQRFFDAAWMKANILTGHGPLCALYEAEHDGSFRSEGDSPAFMHLIDVGLGSTEDPAYGGWGGRFEWRGSYWRSVADDGNPYKPILRWAAAFQNDWAARAAWCVRPPSNCNHAPRAVCNRDTTKKVLHVTAKPGSELRLSAVGSSDPDGDHLTYRWWSYVEAGSYWAALPGRHTTTPEPVFEIPPAASGRTIHLILEITDDGSPPLTAYRRVLVSVSGTPRPSPRELYLQTPITNLQGPSPDQGGWSFYRGVNLNGPPVVIDGHAWDGDKAKDFQCGDRPLNSPRVPLRPPTDPARAAMIHSFRWNSNAKLTLTNVPTGTYAVYLYSWEDNNPEILTFVVNGKVRQRDRVSGVAGEWHRLGPWPVTVQNGRISIETRGGAANISGVEVWKKMP